MAGLFTIAFAIAGGACAATGHAWWSFFFGMACITAASEIRT
jgi:hypothetical protein